MADNVMFINGTAAEGHVENRQRAEPPRQALSWNGEMSNEGQGVSTAIIQGGCRLLQAETVPCTAGWEPWRWQTGSRRDNSKALQRKMAEEMGALVAGEPVSEVTYVLSGN